MFPLSCKISIAADVTIVAGAPNKVPLKGDKVPLDGDAAAFYTKSVTSRPFKTQHNFVGPEVPGTPVIIAKPNQRAFELPVPMWWPPGTALGMNKFSKKVVHRGLWIALDGHDCGVGIWHWQLLPNSANALTPVQIMFSSRKAIFSADTVRTEGKPTVGGTLGPLPAPMMACMDPFTCPAALNTTAWFSTSVAVGMTLGDLLRGLLGVGVSMATDKIAGAIVKKFRGTGPAKDALWKVEDIAKAKRRKTYEEILINLGLRGDHAAKTIKSGIGFATGVVKMCATDGSAEAKLPVGSDFLQVEAGVVRDDKGNYKGVLGGRFLFFSVEKSTDGKPVKVEVDNPVGENKELTGPEEPAAPSKPPQKPLKGAQKP